MTKFLKVFLPFTTTVSELTVEPEVAKSLSGKAMDFIANGPARESWGFWRRRFGENS